MRRCPRVCRAAGACAVALWALLFPLRAGAFDLLDAYRLAVRNDPTIEVQRQSLAVAVDQTREARSALLPSLAANSQAGRTGGPVTYTGTPTLDRTFNTFAWTVQLTVPVLHLQELAAYRESNRLAAQARAEFSRAQQDLIVRLAKAYFGVLIARDALDAANAQWRAAEAQRAAAQHSFERGVGSITDVDEALARAAMARAQRASARSEIDSKRAELEQIIGPIPGASLAALRADVRIGAPEPAALDRWVAQAQDNNPSVIALRSAIDAAGFDLEKARAQRVPTVDLVGSYGRNYSSGNNINPIDFATNGFAETAMLQMNMLLVDGGAVQARISAAAAKEAKAQAQLEAARRQAAVDARQAYEGVVDGLDRIGALQDAVEAGIRSVAGNRAGYRAGIRINTDVLDSERQRYAAQRDLAKARYDTLLQTLKLKAAAGILDVADLLRLNAMFVSSAVRDSLR